MNIGFDAKWYFNGPVSGKVVVKNLLKNLIKNENHTIVPIFNINDKSKVLAEFGNIDCIYTKIKNPLISNVFEVPFLEKTKNMDIIIFQNFSPFFKNFKAINYIHDIIFEEKPEFFTILERIYFFPIKYLSKRADLVITISKNEKKRILRYNYSKNVEYVYHGVQPSLHTSSELNENTMTLPKKYILAVGRINIRKNLANLIKAFELIEDKEIKLVIVGERSWKNKKISISNNLESRILFLNNISNDQLGAIYSKAHIFCFISLDEGFGLPIVEAMSFGIPTIVSNCSVMPEIANEAAIKVDPLDRKDIAQAIDSLLNKDSLYLEQKKLSLNRSKFFSWKESSKKLIKICENYFEKKGDRKEL